MPGAALIGGLASIAGSGISQMIAGQQAQEAFGRQKELMALQNQYAVENWARENRYNTPAEQRKRLKDAGLNPDLMYGSGGVGNQAGSIDAPGAPSAPMAPTMDFSKAIDSAVQAAVGIANAKKAGSETIAQNIENEYLSKTLTDRIQQVALQNDWTKEQTAKTTQEISMIVGQQNALREQIEVWKSSKKFTDKQVEWYDRHMKAEIDHLKASKEYQEALKGLTESQKQVLDSTMDSLVRISNAQADQLETLVGLMQKYGDAQAIIGMASQIIGSATDILGMFVPSKAVTNIYQGVTKHSK